MSVADLVVPPPVAPMLARLERRLPDGDYLYEPKWDGFRGIVFRHGGDLEIGSRNELPLTRYFPELVADLLEALPDAAVVDGEVVVAGPGGLDFDALSQRVHPALSRVKMLAEKTPASFVAFDLLALGGRDLRSEPFHERRPRAGGDPGPGPADRAGRGDRPGTPRRRRRGSGPWPRTGSSVSKAPGWTGWWPNPATSPTWPASGSWSK